MEISRLSSSAAAYRAFEVSRELTLLTRHTQEDAHESTTFFATDNRQLLRRSRTRLCFSESPVIEKFTQALPGLGPTGIPLQCRYLKPLTRQTFTRLKQGNSHNNTPAGYGKTTFWGYVDANGAGYPNNQRCSGSADSARKGRPVRLQVTNKLPNKHILPIDTTLMGAESDQFVNRICVHSHGGSRHRLSTAGLLLRGLLPARGILPKLPSPVTDVNAF